VVDLEGKRVSLSLFFSIIQREKFVLKQNKSRNVYKCTSLFSIFLSDKQIYVVYIVMMLHKLDEVLNFY